MEDQLNIEITNRLLEIDKYLQHRKGRSRGQENILKILEVDGPMSPKELGSRLRIQPGSISEIVSKLEKQGFVLKTKSETDKRGIELSISEEGKHKLTDIKRKGNDELLDCLEEQEKTELLNLLDKVSKNIDFNR